MNDATSQDKRYGEQLSDLAIRERLRAATPMAIARLIELCQSKNPNVAMGAAKVILAKVVPDLKAMEHSNGKDGKDLPTPLLIRLVED